MPSSSVRVTGTARGRRRRGSPIAGGWSSRSRRAGWSGSRRAACEQAADGERSKRGHAGGEAAACGRGGARNRARTMRPRVTPGCQVRSAGPKNHEPLASTSKEGLSAGRSHGCLPFLSKVEHRPRGRRPDFRSSLRSGGHRSGTVPEFHRLRDHAASFVVGRSVAQPRPRDDPRSARPDGAGPR